MSSAALALQAAMQQRLAGDAGLKAVLGGAYVYASLPRGAPASHAEFTAIDTRDWSTADAPGFEHFVTIMVRSPAREPVPVQQAATAIEDALDGAPLALDGHRLVNLRLVFSGLQKTGASFTATFRFRAATEPL